MASDLIRDWFTYVSTEPRHRDHRDRDRDRDRGWRNIIPHISALTAEDDDQWPPSGCTSDPLFPDVINIDA